MSVSFTGQYAKYQTSIASRRVLQRVGRITICLELTWLEQVISGRSANSTTCSVPRIIMLGGDHTTTLSALRSTHERWGAVSVIHFDSHIGKEERAFWTRLEPIVRPLTDGNLHQILGIQKCSVRDAGHGNLCQTWTHTSVGGGISHYA